MERAITVTVGFKDRSGWTDEERSLELRELAQSAGAKVVREEIVHRHAVDPASFIGSGKAEELSRICADERVGVAIFNNDLSGTQQKNLEEAMRVKTLDRTQLILDIFAKRAHSEEGKIQVELAQLLYLLPRLTGKGVYLSRLGGGIGTRGPGEQKLEVDRRRIRSKVARLQRELESLRERRAMMRKNRERFSLLTIAIIGYTNVGKSTLLNALTDSAVMVENRLFSTLDPTVRKFTLPNKQKVLFVDTVGFLDHLPHHLIEAFKATLEEVVEADLLLHLVDISHPKRAEQSEAVYKVLKEIGAGDKRVLTVLNKVDKVRDAGIIGREARAFNDAVTISALRREGFDALAGRIVSYADPLMATLKMRLDIADARTLSFLYENGRVTKTQYTKDSVYVEAEVPARIKAMLGRIKKESIQ